MLPACCLGDIIDRRARHLVCRFGGLRARFPTTRAGLEGGGGGVGGRMLE